MPRFHFDLYEDARLTPDDVGRDFPDLETAEREAALTALAVAREVLPAGRVREVVVEVLTGDGEIAAVVKLSMERTRLTRD